MRKIVQFTSLLVAIYPGADGLQPCIECGKYPNHCSRFNHSGNAITQTAVRETQVQSVEIQFMQTDPVQVNAIVRGNLTEFLCEIRRHPDELRIQHVPYQAFDGQPNRSGLPTGHHAL